ncbi:MAG: hypothetical protein R3C17_22190, partial [Planctomycetaceae bacterium]
KQVALSQQVVVQEQPQQKQALIPASYPTVELPYDPYPGSSACQSCGCVSGCTSALEYSTCHGCSSEDNICVENYKRRWPGKSCLDRWFCDPWRRAYSIQPAGCCESKTWYKFE